MHFHLIHFCNVSETCNVSKMFPKHYKNGTFFTLFATRHNAFNSWQFCGQSIYCGKRFIEWCSMGNPRASHLWCHTVRTTIDLLTWGRFWTEVTQIKFCHFTTFNIHMLTKLSNWSWQSHYKSWTFLFYWNLSKWLVGLTCVNDISHLINLDTPWSFQVVTYKINYVKLKGFCNPTEYSNKQHILLLTEYWSEYWAFLIIGIFKSTSLRLILSMLYHMSDG